MNSSRFSMITLLLIFYPLLSPSFAIGQGHTISDEALPTNEDTKLALETVHRINAATLLMRRDFVEAYYSEIRIGRCVWGLSRDVKDSVLIKELKMFSHLRDSTIGSQCVLYLQTHQNRFDVVDDGFKGENNYWEPNTYWLKRIRSEYPGSRECYEIEFDLEFASLIRNYRPDPDARGKTCAEYVTEDLARSRSSYLEVYSEDDFKNWIPECDAFRKLFQALKTKMLVKYKSAPFTMKLQDIDSTTIVPFHSVE